MILELQSTEPVPGTTAMFHMKLKPSTDVWVCRHLVAYPDICEACVHEHECSIVSNVRIG